MTPEKEIFTKAMVLADSVSPTKLKVCECRSLCPTLNQLHVDLHGRQDEEDVHAIAATPEKSLRPGVQYDHIVVPGRDMDPTCPCLLC